MSDLNAITVADPDPDMLESPAEARVRDELLPHGDNPWNIQKGEPIRWFILFQRYYLTQTGRRSIRAAYRQYVEIEKPERLEARGGHHYNATPRNWLRMARDWKWQDRANQFDLACGDIITDHVQMAFEMLREAAPDAAAALVASLDNPRTRVQGAKEILDRIGLPSTSRHESVSVRITADDIKNAAKDAAEWENQMFEQSG